MRKIAIALLLLSTLAARSQENEAFYVFNADWTPTKIDSAHFLLHVHKLAEGCWQWDYYNFIGPLLKTEQYADKDGHNRNGVTRFYNAEGLLDSSATFKNGKMDGDAYKLTTDSFRIKMKYVYRDDTLVSVIDPAIDKKDSIQSIEKESEFPGGLNQWVRYLNKHLKYPDRAVNSESEGEVRVLFIVGKEGEIQDPYIAKSVEYSLDDESLRIVIASGKWQPGVKDGKVVKTYKIQPVVFRLK